MPKPSLNLKMKYNFNEKCCSKRKGENKYLPWYSHTLLHRCSKIWTINAFLILKFWLKFFNLLVKIVCHRFYEIISQKNYVSLSVEYINKINYHLYILVYLEYILCQVMVTYSTNRYVNCEKPFVVHYNYRVSWPFISFKSSFKMFRGGFIFSKELHICQPCSILNDHIEVHGYMSKGLLLASTECNNLFFKRFLKINRNLKNRENSSIIK